MVDRGLNLMGNDNKERSFFPLKSLQIGDLQSYLSHLSLFMAPETKKIYILVDNQPWLNELVHRPTHLWQLMVTKIVSFAITRTRKKRKGADVTAGPKESESVEMKTWFSLIDATTLSGKRVLLDVNKLRNTLVSNSLLHRTLYGFIVFEIAWNDIRGMNYLNELQTPTSFAVEARVMKRWEFDSIKQAAKYLSLWFPGTINELILLKEYLDVTTGSLFFDAEEDFPTNNDATDFDVNIRFKDGSSSYNDNDQRSQIHPTPLERATNLVETLTSHDGLYKRKTTMKSISSETEIETLSREGPSDNTGSPTCDNIESLISDNTRSPTDSQRSYDSESEDLIGSQYKDVFVVFRFEDGDLPFELKYIIMSNLRLLTLLEAGLPSWVIFLQSYPGFCHIYRPWMCPMARALYVLMSTVTVLIGFYDLYKNVPLLKATFSHLFGPFFDWIENWEMITRIRYLGTMLFLHNIKKAVKWFLKSTRAVRSFLKIIVEPMLGPFAEFLDITQPLYSGCMQLVEGAFSAIWTVLEFLCSLIGDFLEIMFLPIWYLVAFMWTTVISILYPIFWTLREIIYVPIRVALPTSSFVAYIFTSVRDSVLCAYRSLNALSQLSSQVSKVGSTVTSNEVSMWRSLWNDLFSQIFKAVSAILRGFVAFFATCNRHRLSIYKSISRKISRPSDSMLGIETYESLLKVHKEEDESPSLMSKKIR